MVVLMVRYPRSVVEPYRSDLLDVDWNWQFQMKILDLVKWFVVTAGLLQHYPTSPSRLPKR